MRVFFPQLKKIRMERMNSSQMSGSHSCRSVTVYHFDEAVMTFNALRHFFRSPFTPISLLANVFRMNNLLFLAFYLSCQWRSCKFIFISLHEKQLLCSHLRMLYLNKTLFLRQTLSEGRSDWHCPLYSTQHQYLNPCQQHLEFSSGLPSKYYVA